MKTALLTTLAMIAFAANSLLCRWALGENLIDPASFASIRVVSGAILLAVMLGRRTDDPAEFENDWQAAVALFVYLIFFSYAYVTLAAGAGALILFGAVQLTMFAIALRNGERFSKSSWIGFVFAVAGLVYLLSPGLSAPPIFGGSLMAVAGVAWGAYSLRGRGSQDPLKSTARNFALAVPFVVVVNIVFVGSAYLSMAGVVLAATSGMLASALGYVVWYAALRHLAAMTAATVQLSVPVITAAGGVVLLAEDLTVRLLISSGAILGGIALVVSRRKSVGAASVGAASSRE